MYMSYHIHVFFCLSCFFDGLFVSVISIQITRVRVCLCVCMSVTEVMSLPIWGPISACVVSATVSL